MNIKRHIAMAAIGGILGFGFGLAFEVCCWLAFSDTTFSWSTPKFLGLFFAFLGALEPFRSQQNA
ncbi:hypothetical protein [Burkholderia pseudomallei]|uniref:hypothetical protein n=1 Tax=Burkholderia pseudomallei TaxID=28450 RepID=UPI000538FCD5|nr:hypothetical protein [Burkholderia pseudomallei]KGW92050.1 putative membrane protein [Burkholderia pseudomallei MSHR456]